MGFAKVAERKAGGLKILRSVFGFQPLTAFLFRILSV